MIEDIIAKADVAGLRYLQNLIDERSFELGIGKYSTGKIYNVEEIATGEVAYTGSTIKELEQRWGGHKGFFKSNPHSSYTQHIVSRGGPNKFHIKLVEHYPCRSFAELLSRERHFIVLFKPVCNVNMRLEETDEDTRERRKAKETLDKKREQEAMLSKWFSETTSRISHEHGKTLARYAVNLTKPKDQRIYFQIMCEKYPELVQGSKNCPLSDVLPSMHLLQSVQRLCAILHLHSSHDTETEITENVMNNSLTELEEIVSDLQKILGAKPTSSSSDKPLKKLKLNIDGVLSAFANTKMKGKLRRSRADGKACHYDYRIAPLAPHIADMIDVVVEA